jgi:hypothetical protein
MAGQIKMLIDKIVHDRSKGNSTLIITTKTKIILKGVDPDLWNALSPDDPLVLNKVKLIAQELGVKLA